MAAVKTVYVCEVPGCRSRLELSDPDDLKSPAAALKARGWEWMVKRDGKPPHTHCQAHHGYSPHPVEVKVVE